MLTGLSAFPLTPMNEQTIDEVAFVGLIERLAAAGVDSIGVLGSTGNYAYLTRDERARITRLAVAHAGDCLLYTSPSPRDRQKSRMPSSA